MGPTTPNDAADDHVHIIGGVAFAGNHRVVSETDWASPKCENAVLYSLLIAISTPLVFGSVGRRGRSFISICGG
jgi:hypothetical protein